MIHLSQKWFARLLPSRVWNSQSLSGAVMPLSKGMAGWFLERPKKLSMYKKNEPKHDVGFPTIKKNWAEAGEGSRVLICSHPPQKNTSCTWWEWHEILWVLKFHIWSADLFIFVYFCYTFFVVVWVASRIWCLALWPPSFVWVIYTLWMPTPWIAKRNQYISTDLPQWNLTYLGSRQTLENQWTVKVNIELLSKQWVDYRLFTHRCRVLANPQLIYYKSLLYLVVEPPISKMRPQNMSKIPHHLWRPREFFIFHSLPSFFGINLLVKFRDNWVYP